jgi:hypothetical protein
MAAFGVCLTTAAAFAVKEGVGSRDTVPQPSEYVVKSFRYDAAKNIGEIMAGETFSNSAGRPQAAKAMEAALAASRYEFAEYFPDVPAQIRNGDISCHVLASTQHDHHFDLLCVAAPDSSQTNA